MYIDIKVIGKNKAPIWEAQLPLNTDIKLSFPYPFIEEQYTLEEIELHIKGSKKCMGQVFHGICANCHMPNSSLLCDRKV